nr:photosystem II reaction center protein Z [Poropsis sp. ID1_4]
MNFLFQFAILSFIAFSFILVIGFPIVVFGSSTTFALSWNENKKKIFIVIGFWFLLLFIVGIFNSFFV